MRLVAIVVVLLVRSAGAAPLTKTDVRASLKQLVPAVKACYAEARRHDAKLGGGVFNMRLSIESTASGVTIKPLDFDTTGRLGDSTELRDCSTRVLATTLSPITVTGTIVLIYPLTFGDQPPDNRNVKLLATAKRAAAAGRWRTALATAERGLADVTFDGTVRRQLIEIAGIAACSLKLRAKARHYVELSPATAEQAVREACKRAGAAL